MKRFNLLTVIVVVLLLSAQVFASDYPLTNKRFALGAMSLCALNETIQAKEELKVYVMGDEEVAEELQIFLNQRIGKIFLVSIESGDKLPKEKPDALILCDELEVGQVKQYCRDNGIFSISRSTLACQQGVSTAIVSKLPSTIEHEYSMTSVYAKINKKALYAEGMTFYPQIMEVAKPIENSELEQDVVYIQLF